MKDGNWHVLAHLDDAPINNYMGDIPTYKPNSIAKLAYDDDHLFLYFSVADKHVFFNVVDDNGPVSKDACVEFFFAPDEREPTYYFNLEINVGGVALMRYNADNLRASISIADLKTIAITSSLSLKQGQVIDDPVEWEIRCNIPINILKKYAVITAPGSGVIWRGNFYKTAGTGLNKHWITWAKVESVAPRFHMPAYFGKLMFE